MRYPIRGLKGKDGFTDDTVSVTQIFELDTPFLKNAISLYNQFKIFKILPHGKGTMNERASVLEALMILEEEANLWEAWEMEKMRSGIGNKD